MEERFDRVEQRMDQHGELIAELRAATLANSQNLDRLAGISERFISVAVDAITELRITTNRLEQNVVRLDRAIEELRASNRRQESINDYLIRRDRERGS
ncbi:hypothetical protein [Gloeobacter morelensis]|uniref:Uncharacterized protein n=1 Tax=Gloeobacter morelensis MG652769 TaxID=2781736 RepID=A0ABY3PSG3_9CYAN|nr:hypothetical protein [Gloeobacter morelensis]UFP96677.1 hypothetical protein ISF26_10890 [Gloeobacter morelensis MG652769]